MLRKSLLICSLSLALLIVGLIEKSWPRCEPGGDLFLLRPREAKAKVTWIHPTLIGDFIVPHPHRVDYSVSARVGNQKADSKADFSTFMSNKRFMAPKSVIAFQKGIQRWNGDGYASSSISEHGSSDNWRFCAKP